MKKASKSPQITFPAANNHRAPYLTAKKKTPRSSSRAALKKFTSASQVG